MDSVTANATCRRIFDELERDGTLNAFCHYTHPGFGILVKDGGRRVFRAL